MTEILRTRLGILLAAVCLSAPFACGDGEAGETPSAAPESRPAAINHTTWASARGDDLNRGISDSPDAREGKARWHWIAGNRLWQSPVARDGVFYVGDFNLNFYAVRIADGHQLWRSRPRIIKTEKTELIQEGESISDRIDVRDLDDHYGYSIPVLDEDQVITITEYGVMTAFDLKNGDIRWEHDFEGKVMSSPRIQGDRIVVNATDGHCYAFDKNTGEELWRYWTSAKMLGSSVAFIGPHTALFPGHDRFLHTIDTRTGKEIERIEVGAVSASTPLIAFGCAYFTASGGRFCCFDLVDQRMRWEKRAVVAASHSLALSGDHVLVHAREELQAWHGVSGKLIWKTDLKGAGAVAPCVGPELVYITTEKGDVFALRRQDGEIVWRDHFGESSRSHPVLVDGLLLVSDLKGRMTAYE